MMQQFVGRSIAGFIVLVASTLTALSPARAAQTDLSPAPITSTTSAQVKPNIMLLMDTSGSMGWGHMPDEVEGDSGGSGLRYVGYKSSQCNILYYNPDLAHPYQLPKKPDGTPFPVPSFKAARYAGYSDYYTVGASDPVNTTAVDLSTSFRAYDSRTTRNGGTPDAAQPAYYYVYSGPQSQTLNYATAPCTDKDNGVTRAATGGGTWTRVDVSQASAEQQANFAIWYSYYRVRISLTKSAASLAFTPLTDTFRVGFITVQPKDNPADAKINQSKYLKIDDFNSGQRNDWYSKLFAQVPGGASPAREGLARVGRMYAGKHDSINGGMDDDPVQYSCQQNFTILTTDGYWNTQTESTSATGLTSAGSGATATYYGGPLGIDGKTLVGQTDGTLGSSTTAVDLPHTVVVTSPRPIWDGTTDGTSVVENYTNTYAYANCGSFASRSTAQVLRSSHQITQSTSQNTQTTLQLLQSTVQNLASTVQNLQSTVQNVVTTSQPLRTTSRILKSTFQNLQSTTQINKSTLQTLQSTNQNLQSTVQNLQSTAQTLTNTSQVTQTVKVIRQSTTQNLKSTTQTRISTSQPTTSTTQQFASTSQLLKSTNQNRQSTTQTLMSTVQNLQSTTQNRQSTTQNLQSTSQVLQSTSQATASTLKLEQSTSQNTVTTLQVQETRSQTRACDARTELCTYQSAQCTPSTFVRCETTVTGPTLVANCTQQTASDANNYTQVTCTSSGTGPTSTSSCSPTTANASNSYTTTTCKPVTTGPTAVASCTPTTASAGNNYTTTSCTSTATPATPVASCKSEGPTGANGFVATSCNTVTTGPTGVASCTAGSPTIGNGYTTTTCTPVTTNKVPVATCSAAAPTASNNYTTTSCPAPAVTTNVPVASCSASGPTAANNYTTTNCDSVTTTNVAVPSCLASAGTSSNSYTTTTCATNNTSNVPIASCASSGPTVGNGYTTTTCVANNKTNAPIDTCTASGPTPGNGYTTTTCQPSLTSTDVPSPSCTPAPATSGNSYTTTTCRTATTPETAVASCTAAAASSGNSYTATMCRTVATGPSVVESCTGVPASSANSYTATVCGSNDTGPTAVASCSPSPGTSANSYVTTTCPVNNQTDVPVASCAASGPNIGNGYTTTTCPTPKTTSNVAVASCTPATAANGNSWTTTTCSTNTVSGPAVVASCTPSGPTMGNGFQTTTCGSNTTSNALASCTPSGPTAGNNYTTTTCVPKNTNNVPVASCTPSGPTAGNKYTTTTCPAPVTTTNVPVAACTASAPTAANKFTTITCPAPVVTNNVPVASCTPAAATNANSYTSVACPTVATGPTAAPSCTPIPPDAGNSYTSTTCTRNDTTNVGVPSCNVLGPTPANGYTTTTCPSPAVTTDVAAPSCTATTASNGNSWVSTTCRTDTATDTPVQTCDPTVPDSSNGYTTTTCTTKVVGPSPTATCTPDAATDANGWTTRTCPAAITTTNAPIPDACVATPALSGNNYTAVICPAPIVTTNAPQAAACVPSLGSLANKYVTTTCPSAPVTTTNVPVASCTPSDAASANQYVTTTCSKAETGPTPVAACTPSAASSANSYTATSCPAAKTTGPTGVPSCKNTDATDGNRWVTTTCGNNDTTDVAVAACSDVLPSDANGYQTATCKTKTTGPEIVDLSTSSCTTEAATDLNSFTATTCTKTFGSKLQYTQTHTRVSQLYSGGVKVGDPVADPPVVAAAADVPPSPSACFAPNSEPKPPVVPSPEPLPTPPSACTAWPCTTTRVNSAGSTNSLADVAQYYYINDLRPASAWPATGTKDISTDNVPPVGSGPEDDRVQWQHMTTFTLGLGVSGTLKYRSDYPSATDGDFASIRTGVSTTNADGTKTATAWPLWPDPAAVDYSNFDNWSNPKSIDDFWHTAVNGRGRYFSAGDPTSVVAGLSGALFSIVGQLSGGAAAGVTTSQPSDKVDSRSFVGQYTTSDWTGDLVASSTDLTTAASGTTPLWSAQALLDKKTGALCDDRRIYLMHGAKGDALVNFTWDGSISRCTGTVDNGPGLDNDEKANFSSANTQQFSQWADMSAVQQGNAPGAALVNFLRGQRGHEEFTAGDKDKDKLYRTRKHVLGDIVNAQPVFVGAPTFNYGDAGYSEFKNAQVDRTPMVYVAANDGMLHAFRAGKDASDVDGGQEAWAVIPSAVLPNLFRLADANYRNIHQFSVDGTPVVADAHDASGWKTLLVAGLNDGGRGYYALDVTDPTKPRALWEFKAGSTCHGNGDAGYTGDCYLGYSFGKPVVTKLPKGAKALDGSTIPDNTWVVMFSSGYNNIGGGSEDGKGFLYVVDAMTGAVIYRIPTQVGSAATPSGLAQINSYLEYGSVDNTVVNVYAGDVLGNVWRFNLSSAAHDATLIGTAKDKTGVPQPITVRPELAEVGGKPMVLIGTGRLLGASDIGDLQVQSIYGIVDQLPATGTSCTASSSPPCEYSNLRGALKPLSWTVSTTTKEEGKKPVFSPRNIVDCTSTTDPACKSPNGWVIDFPMQTDANNRTGNVGERVNVDMKLAQGTLVVGSNVPQSSACTTGGYSWISNIDLATGLAVQDTPNNLEVSTILSVDSLLVGFNIAIASGSTAHPQPPTYFAPGQLANGSGVSPHVRVAPLAPVGKRISWREIVQQ